ncbi:uncharacterized protein LOC116294954 [Actinia tenebrosa]|uniref:Uncharacterized protein LOC116294954 n=1 Tax=Actinia tenebrosa TaxID=6105 RepID=A0A6P8HSV1_ACTTE|nr:uncharacterized protein LOC116294954 [Actinia tenebrosa]
MTDDICKQLSGMPLLQDISVLSCSPNNLLAICSKEKFLLIFLDKYCEETCISKICSTLRYDSSSINSNVPIIGVSDAERDHTSNYGLNEVITFPLREEAVNQLLLKFAGIIPFKGLPLTPESPDDDVAVARKAAEIMRESEEQSMLSFNKDGCVSKDSKEVKSSFDPPEEPDSPSKQVTCSLYSNSNNNLYLPLSFPMDQDHSTNTRQQTLNYNTTASQEFTRSTVSSFYNADSFRTRDHASWEIPQDFPSGHMTQNVVSGQHMGIYGDHVIGCHSSTSVSGIYQHSYPAVPGSNQLPLKPVSQYLTTNNSYGNKPQDKSIQSRNVIQPTGNMTSSLPTQVKMNTFGTPAYMVSGAPGTKDMKITILPEDLSKHSSKERIRRERIKESCDKLRFLLPNISGKKTDMASILEMTVKFVKLVNERTPAPVMQEIAESLSVDTISLCRKRGQKELAIQPSKQAKPRLVSPQLSVPMVPSVMPADTQGHYRLRGPPIVGNNGPVYLSHVHGQHCTPTPYQYSQYPPTINYGSSYNPLTKDIQGGYYPGTHTSVVNQGYSCNVSKDTVIPVVQTFQPPQSTNAQICHPMNAQINVCQHRPLPGNTSSTNSDMPQQWSFLKLPPINTISPCSSTHFSRSSSEEQSTGSNMSSPSGSMNSPLWDEPRNTSCPL